MCHKNLLVLKWRVHSGRQVISVLWRLCNSLGCVAQLTELRSLAGELTLSCAQPAADG